MIDIDKEFYEEKEIELFGKKIKGKVMEISKLGAGDFYKVKILFPTFSQHGVWLSGNKLPHTVTFNPETVEFEIVVQVEGKKK